MNLLVAPFVNALFGFYYLTGNLGWSVVVVTVLIRLLLLPLLLPSLKSAKKMRDLQPKLKRLQEKYGKDKEGLAKAQMSLYKEEGINPLSGCLPQILQIAVLIIFFQAFNMVTTFSEGKGSVPVINSHLIQPFKINDQFRFQINFLGSDLGTTPAKTMAQGFGWWLILPGLLLVGSGVLQYISAKMMMPAPKLDETAVAKTKDKEDDMMGAMRTQSLYMMPLMTVFIGWNFSLGILLYWFVNSLVMIAQQMIADRLQKKV
jgi:YidC/Oxa1 family membrane protein insertase